MNKLICIVTSVLLVNLSCVKNRTCNCTKTNNKVDTTITVQVTIVKSTKSQAKANCISTTRRGNDTTYTTKCTLN